ncbi:MAG: ERF family protein [Holosporaceae bacterium]|jgi:hypothetical protein|nr:ERF family protein [Holosporaceae bacterium]
MEEKKLNIYDKLAKARVQLQKLNLKKSGRNKFSGFSYYELSDFLPRINEIFENLGLYSRFCTDTDKKAAYLTIINRDNPEEQETYSSPTAEIELKGCTAIQAVGAVHTYMKRYLYMNALEIVENDMLDAQAGDISKDEFYVNYENIADLNELNKAYKFLVDHPTKDSFWKQKIRDKAESLGATFNLETKKFEPNATAMI